jgi:hypothetical protein
MLCLWSGIQLCYKLWKVVCYGARQNVREYEVDLKNQTSQQEREKETARVGKVDAKFATAQATYSCRIVLLVFFSFTLSFLLLFTLRQESIFLIYLLLMRLLSNI